MKRSVWLSSLSLLVLGLITGVRAHAQTYRYVDLGSLNLTRVTGINNSGQIVGYSLRDNNYHSLIITPLDIDGDGRPDTWFVDANNDGINDLARELPIPAGYTGNIPHAINASGQVAGETTGNYTNRVNQLASLSTVNTVAVVGSGKSVANGINDNGVLAGWAYYTSKGTSSNTFATWQLTKTTKGTAWAQTVIVPPAPYVSAYATCINNSGAVAGTMNGSAAAVWLPAALYSRPQGWTILPSLGTSGGGVRQINSLGQMVGYSNSQGALWLLESAFGLPAGVFSLTPAGTIYTSSDAWGMNNAPSGILSVVGQLKAQGSDWAAFLWRSDTTQTIDLNTATSGIPAGWVLWQAIAVNDSGVIICTACPAGSGGSGPLHNVVLVPVP